MTAPLPTTLALGATDVVGTVRRLGSRGPAYFVRGVDLVLPGGDVLVRLVLLETREEVVLPASMVLRHPEAG